MRRFLFIFLKLLESIAKTKSKANAYGVAALSMVEFANGLRYLEATLPVLPVDETIGHDQSKTIQVRYSGKIAERSNFEFQLRLNHLRLNNSILFKI